MSIQQTLFYGSDLTEGKEPLPEVTFIKVQCDELTKRWNKLRLASDTRHFDLENGLEICLKEEIKNFIFWIKKKENEIEKVEKKKKTPEKLDLYLDVIYN